MQEDSANLVEEILESISRLFVVYSEGAMLSIATEKR